MKRFETIGERSSLFYQGYRANKRTGLNYKVGGVIYGLRYTYTSIAQIITLFTLVR